MCEKYFPSKNSGIALESFKPGDKNIPFEIVAEFSGRDLVSVRYEQLMPYLQPLYDVEKAFQLLGQLLGPASASATPPRSLPISWLFIASPKMM